MRIASWLGIVLAAPLLTLMVPGCESKGYKTAPVSGRVTLDGKPLIGATVSFSLNASPPAGGKPAPAATGTTDENGNFTLKIYEGNSTTDGAPVGENRVSIQLDDRDSAKAVHRGAPRELVPAKYNAQSTLTFPVPSGGTKEANFDLKSK